MARQTDPRSEYGELTPAALPAGVHRTLYELWLAKSDPDRLPGRTDFDPLEMPGLLPHLILVDIERSPWRFQARLFGTAIVDAIGFDPTNRYLDEVEGTAPIHERAVAMALSAKPYFLDNEPLNWSAHDYKNYSTLGLPLARDGKTVDMLIYSMLFD